jgi:hypothetical protein
MSRQIEIPCVESGSEILSRFYLRSVSNLAVPSRISSGRDSRRDNPTLRTVYEFCDSILILLLLFVSEIVASSIFSSILENLVNENQLSVSFSFVRKKESEIENKVVFLFCSSVCVVINSSIESLLVLVFFVFESVK